MNRSYFTLTSTLKLRLSSPTTPSTTSSRRPTPLSFPSRSDPEDPLTSLSRRLENVEESVRRRFCSPGRGPRVLSSSRESPYYVLTGSMLTKREIGRTSSQKARLEDYLDAGNLVLNAAEIAAIDLAGTIAWEWKLTYRGAVSVLATVGTAALLWKNYGF